MKNHFLLSLVWIFLLFLSSSAHALICTFSASDVAFGAIDILAGTANDTTATVNISCTGVPLTTMRICMNLNAGTGGADNSGRFMQRAGGGTLTYQLYQNPARTTIWGSTSWGLTGGPVQLDLPLGLTGSASTTATIYGRVLASQTMAHTGSYSSAFSGGQTLFAYAVSTGLFDCNTIGSLPPITASPTFNVTANINDNCAVTAQNINFGSHGVLGTNVDATGQVSITCTTSTNYTVGLNGGNANGPPTARKMSKLSETVTYALYQDAAHNLPWGNTINTNTIAGTGTGLTQNLTVYGRVAPQSTPSSGTYTDTVVVTVTY
jgi:spore coat protein U-like protein